MVLGAVSFLLALIGTSAAVQRGPFQPQRFDQGNRTLSNPTTPPPVPPSDTTPVPPPPATAESINSSPARPLPINDAAASSSDKATPTSVSNSSSSDTPTPPFYLVPLPSQSNNSSDWPFQLSTYPSVTTPFKLTGNGSSVYATGSAPPRLNLSGVGSATTTTRASIYEPGPRPTNLTCGGATLNIRNASLDWWYPQTYTQVESTFYIQFDDDNTATGWTLLPATQAFNVTSAVDVPSCTSVTAFNTDFGETMLQYSCWDTPTPVAAATTTIDQTAYKPIRKTTSHGSIPDVVVTPTPAAISVGDSGSTYSQGTAFVHFSEYEVVRKHHHPIWNGTRSCVTITKVYELSEPISFEYTGEAEVNALLAKGNVHAGLLQTLEENSGEELSTVSLGTWKAEPTVVVVVQKIVAAAAFLAKGGIESSATELETPSATLPSGLSWVETTPTDTGTIWAPLTVRLESTALSLYLPTRTRSTKGPATSVHTKGNAAGVKLTTAPFIAHFETTDITLDIPVAATDTRAVVTAVFSGHTVIATRLQNIVGGDGFVPPTDALEVLSQALATFPPGNPTASAIAAGIGGGVNEDGSEQRPVLTIGTSVGTATRLGDVIVVGGQTVSAGGAPITLDGTVVSVAPGATAVVIGGSTTVIGSATNPGAAANIPLITIGSQIFTGNAATQFNVGGSVLTPGGVIVVSGTTISMAEAADSLVVNGTTRQLSPPAVTAAITAPPILTINGTLVAPNGGNSYIISGQTLTPGGAITLSGTDGPVTISLDSAAKEITRKSGGRTIISHIGLVGAAPDGAPVITIDGILYFAVDYNLGSGATYVIDGQTLIPGGTIVTSGPYGDETISLLLAGTAVVIISEGSTSTSSINGAYGVMPTAAPVLTIGGETFTAINDGTTYVIHDQTLTPAGVDTVTIDGHTYIVSLSPQATLLEITEIGANSHQSPTILETLFPAVVTATAGALPTASVATATGDGRSGGSASRAPSTFTFELAGTALALSSLAFAVWL